MTNTNQPLPFYVVKKIEKLFQKEGEEERDTEWKSDNHKL